MTVQYFGQTARLSEAVVANGFVFLAGMVPERTDVGVAEQTRDVLAQIDNWLAQCGSDKKHILEATVFLPDLADYDAMNEAWDAWVVSGYTPARACVQAKLAKPEWKVEIKISAVQIGKQEA
ncbi:MULTISPECIES: RidA family protein [Neisseria]|uniref:Endoribonuclease L-PSP family protein n=1 Tax=Neisseria musculi TaxID=1815583 RepID=A0A7H1M920_9NEIS|nr:MULTISPECIES: RidA family protein [Neisseria]MBF0804152.1 RidA family protein [Neisseria sp. 19428wB4_WF04]QNT58135.1 endoribonuclease L-PSP family protein [Neisseria musculi]TFU43109.1 RidA family protein [Neisseria sp. WF04]